MFSLVHPAVLEVYLTTLQLTELDDSVDGYTEADLPEALLDKFHDLAINYVKAEDRAIKAVGSKHELYTQLEQLHSRRGTS
jgi:hypothetical protein